jgi:GTP pyrophosphokinase
LRSGDQIEIITSNKQKPSEDWLNMVVTAKARNKIKDALREEKRKIADDGKYVLHRKLEAMGATYSPGNIDEVMRFYKLSSHLDLLYKIATKEIELKELKDFTVLGDRLEAPKPKPVIHEVTEQQHHTTAKRRKGAELIVFGESSDKIQYGLAKCCNPVHGDDIFGFVSTGKGLIIHRTNCPNAPQLLANYAHRIVKTKWAKNSELSFLTGLKIIGWDEVGVISKITNIISGDMKMNIAALTIESNEGIFQGTVKIFVHDKSELDDLVNKLKSLEGIQSVDRIDTEKLEQ